ncbi:MAG: hypothetical protein ACLFUF_00645 [Opitutales bacterium]
MSVFTSRLQEALGLSSMQLSITYMLGTLLSALCLSSGGRFFDRMGARRSIVGSLLALALVLWGLSEVERIASLLGALPGMDVRPWLAAFVALTVGFWFVVPAFSGFIVAWLTDRPYVRVKYLLCLMAVASLLGFGTIAAGDYPEWSWLHVLGYGISGGCFGSLSAIIWPRFYGRTHLGAISGLFMTVLVVSSAVGPFFFSFLESLAGSYRGGFAVAAVAAACLAVAALRADNPQRLG